MNELELAIGVLEKIRTASHSATKNDSLDRLGKIISDFQRAADELNSALLKGVAEALEDWLIARV